MAKALRWKAILRENWRNLSAGDLPSAALAKTVDHQWIGANQDGMYTRILDGEGGSTLTRVLECGGIPVYAQNSGARAVLTNPVGQWNYLAPYEGEVVRLRTFAHYLAPFTMEQGDGLFTQVFAEVKSNYRPNAEVQVLLETRDDGKAYHVLKGLGAEGYQKGSSVPIDWSADNEYGLTLFLSRFSDGWAEFSYKTDTLRVTGPNMSPGGECALIPLFYTNAVKTETTVGVRYPNAILEIQA